MDRKQLVELIVARGASTPQQLQSKSIQELEKILDDSFLAAIRAEAARQVAGQEYPQLIEAQQQVRAAAEKLMWSRIFGTVINGRVAVDNQASRSIIQGWLNLDEQITAEWFNRILAENPGLAKSLTWQSADVLDPRKKAAADAAQTEQDRKTFSVAVRKYAQEQSYRGGIGDTDANFGLVLETLGSGFSWNEVCAIVRDKTIYPSPASEEDLAIWAKEAAEARADYLRNHATPQELREAVRTEADQRRQTLQRADQERQIYGREVADAAFGFPPLPEIHQPTGEKIDAAWLNKISNTNLSLFKALMRKHGAAALTRRLNSRG